VTEAIDVFYSPFCWSDKAPKLAELAVASADPVVKAYADRARSIAKFTWEAGDDVEVLGKDGQWSPLGDSSQKPYGLLVRDQAGGLEILPRPIRRPFTTASTRYVF